MTSLSPESSMPPESVAIVFPPCASFEKPYDLDIVRKIVEREGCVEALQQLLEAAKKSQQRRISGISKAPFVFQSVVDQLRSVSVQIVEDIEQWKLQQKAKAQATSFRWRGVNYLLKMTADLDFLTSFRGVSLLESLQVLRLTQNPFLAQLHLDHPALRESDVESALHLFGNWVGDVSMQRVFPASRLLLRERERETSRRQIRHGQSRHASDLASTAHQTSESESDSVAAVAPYEVAIQQQQRTVPTQAKFHFAGQKENCTVAATTNPREFAMREDIFLSRDLITQAEHELGAMRDELAALQERLEDALHPDKRRRLQTRIGTLVNDLKFRSGDLYQRRNELKRKEAIYRSTKDQRRSGSDRRRPVGAVHSEPTRKERVYSPLFEKTLLEDEQVRNDLVLRANAALAKARTEKNKHSMGLATPGRKLHKDSGGSSEELQDQPLESQSDCTEAWGVCEVQNFLDSLGLDNGSYGANFRAQGIDGALLLQATDRDLEELGVNIRLHRVRILAECKK